MPEVQLEFPDPDVVRNLFGDRDRHLRAIREELGVDVVYRDGLVRIFGDEAHVNRARDVLQSLAAALRRTGKVREVDLWESLGTRPQTGLRPHEVRGAFEFREPAEGKVAPSIPSQAGTSQPGTVQAASSQPAFSQAGGFRFSDSSPLVTTAPAPDAVSGGGAVVDLFERGRRVRPKTPGQDAYLRSIERNELVLALGPAGCGKTYLAVAAAIHALRTERVRKIVLVRPAVEAGEKLGFLPGDMLAKVNPYLRPLLDALNDMLDFDQVQRYMAKDMIEIVPLAFMRGRTLNDTFIILDEGQNTTVTQMKMFLTRMGAGSRIVVTGDVTQLDLPGGMTSGLTDAAERLKEIEGVAVVRLGRADIVRHRLVREIVHAYDS